MAEVVIMPKLGFNIGEGQLVKWYKQMGETVKKDEVLFEINTGKTTMPVETTEDGTLLKIILEGSAFAEVSTPIAMIDAPGEDPDTALASTGQEQAGGSAPATALSAPAAPVDMKSLKLTPRARKLVQGEGIDPASPTQIRDAGFQDGIIHKNLKASPLAREIAQQMDVDLVAVQGTGVTGKIMKTDVEAATVKAASAFAGPDTRQVASVVPYKGMCRVIDEKLAQSKLTTPHLYLADAVDATELAAFRRQLDETNEVKVVISGLLTMTTYKVLKKFPDTSVTLKDDQVITYRSINVGTAVAGDNDLVVPMIRNVQNKALTGVVRESKDLVARARESRLAPEEYGEGTLSISSLGMFGIGSFTAIINAPESTILLISSARKTPVVATDKNGEDTITIRPMMDVQLSMDHRVIDGLLTSQFVECMKQLLEHPIQVLM